MTGERKKAKSKEAGMYPAFYMFTVTFAFAAVLIGLSRVTRENVEANRRIMFERAVVSALGLIDEGSATHGEIHDLFVNAVGAPANGTGGAYVMKDGSRITAYALPFEGQGFWNVIRGVVGIQADGSSMTGISFYEQNETPGLGAEITKGYFRGQFEGKRLSWRSTPVRLMSTAGEDHTGEGKVDAITGATQTCMRLEDMLNAALKEWRNEVMPGEAG